MGKEKDREAESMPMEKSCGAVVINREGGETRYLLIANPSGIWGFPKGHMEAGETERETALREIREETGLDVQFLGEFRAADAHALLREGRPDVTKQITYFLAEYTGQSFRPQPGEVSDIRLMTFQEALNAFQYESSKRILREAAAYVSTHGT